MNFTYGLKCPGCGEKLSLGNNGIECGIHTILATSCSCGFRSVLIVISDEYDLEYKITKKITPPSGG